MAVYRASCSQGVPASAVGPKLVGPALSSSWSVNRLVGQQVVMILQGGPL